MVNPGASDSKGVKGTVYTWPRAEGPQITCSVLRKCLNCVVWVHRGFVPIAQNVVLRSWVKRTVRLSSKAAFSMILQ